MPHRRKLNDQSRKESHYPLQQNRAFSSPELEIESNRTEKAEISDFEKGGSPDQPPPFRGARDSGNPGRLAPSEASDGEVCLEAW